MLVIPAIEISNNTFYRTIQGEPGHEDIYRTLNTSPSELIQLWRRENAQTIQITDRDGYSDPSCTTNRELVMLLANSVDIPISLLTRCENVADYEYYLENGIYRVVLSRFARLQPQATQRLIEKYSTSRVVVGLRCSDDNVVGQENLEPIKRAAFIEFAEKLGFGRLQYTDVEWEGTLTGHDLAELRTIAQSTSMRITIAGGIGGFQDLQQIATLQSDGVDSVVIGRALHENKFPCQKIWRMAETHTLAENNTRRNKKSSA